MTYPVLKTDPMIITSRYENTGDRFKKNSKTIIPHDAHGAVDIKSIDANGKGQPVFAMMKGTVTGIGKTKTNANYVEVVFDTIPEGRFIASYVHTTPAPGIKTSSKLTEGQQIGTSDTSGTTSDAPHLHLALWVEINGEQVRINPLAFFDWFNMTWKAGSQF